MGLAIPGFAALNPGYMDEKKKGRPMRAAL